MEKFIIEKEIGTFNGCKLVLKKETDFTNSDDAILDLNSAETVLNMCINSNFKFEEKNNG